MRIGKFIFTLFLFCSFIAQVIGVQNALSRESESQVISSNSSGQNDNINSLNFIDENLFEELEELEQHNGKKTRRYIFQQSFSFGQMPFGCSSKYKRQKNAYKAEKCNTSHYNHMILLL